MVLQVKTTPGTQTDVHVEIVAEALTGEEKLGVSELHFLWDAEGISSDVPRMSESIQGIPPC